MSADVQFLINLIIFICGGFSAYVLRAVAKEIGDLAAAQKLLAEKIDQFPNIYARRDDMREAMHRIEEAVLRIEAKIDQKADK